MSAHRLHLKGSAIRYRSGTKKITFSHVIGVTSMRSCNCRDAGQRLTLLGGGRPRHVRPRTAAATAARIVMHRRCTSAGSELGHPRRALSNTRHCRLLCSPDECLLLPMNSFINTRAMALTTILDYVFT